MMRYTVTIYNTKNGLVKYIRSFTVWPYAIQYAIALLHDMPCDEEIKIRIGY